MTFSRWKNIEQPSYIYVYRNWYVKHTSRLHNLVQCCEWCQHVFRNFDVHLFYPRRFGCFHPHPLLKVEGQGCGWKHALALSWRRQEIFFGSRCLVKVGGILFLGKPVKTGWSCGWWMNLRWILCGCFVVVGERHPSKVIQDAGDVHKCTSES